MSTGKHDGSANGEVLTVTRLGVSAGELSIVRDASFEIGKGERVGLIGESGSGKSVTASAVMGLLPDELTPAGSVRLCGTELVGAKERTLAELRGRRMAMVFQEPMTALNPAMRIGRQVAEALRLHRSSRGTNHAPPSRKAANQAAVELLERVRLPEPEQTARAYPHQLSGGQRQRVVLAIALANDPDLLICDEPTTALDVTVQARILDLISGIVADRDSALLFITHDLAVVASVCQRVMVMHDGRIVEAGPVGEVLISPQHDYTKRLLRASDLEATE